MHLMARVWAGIAYALSILTMSPFTGPDSVDQAPLPRPLPRGPRFKPPGGRLTGPGSDFHCEYPEMVGFYNCSTRFNRGCWLKNKTFEYNIRTDYENPNLTPVGIHRTYYMNIKDGWINADGMNFTEAKTFDNMYPGPYIQACWGDTVSIIVKNNLRHNGTSVHWHGIRQLNTTHMDGVNGVTQCPIAPGDSFNYTFKAMQYGSSWYHSHYSVQYADGANGPLTLYGPNSARYDQGKMPILLTDWGHNSAFEALFVGLKYPSILLNGVGNVTRYNNSVAAPLKIPAPYNITFARHWWAPKRYLLRIINTSFDTTFVFSIDNHRLQIVEADFVPITPYWNTSVLVGIGQRYHVIVEAKPQYNGKPFPRDGNYWIRTYKADCFGFNQSKAAVGYEKTGILRYHSHSTALPKSSPWNFSKYCSDENYTSLVPVLPWKVEEAANDPTGKVGENFTVEGGTATTFYPLAFFSLGGDKHNPFRLNYENPTFLNLNNTGPWNPLWVVFPENYTDTSWVYMVIKGSGVSGKTIRQHPIHVHGHDFAILQQIEHAKFPHKLHLNKVNPPRRDVVLLPEDGYVVIAFKTDNPGAWLVHCHIANHAAEGLAMQFMERQTDAIDIWPSLKTSHALRTAQAGCFKWNQWWGNCTNWWPGDGSSCKIGPLEASPDSGI